MKPLEEEGDVLRDVREKLRSGEVTSTTLETDNRVLSRITDGIYRSPTAAIRELVANAYDADSTLVTIDMNPPVFDRIIVRDDGEGMDEAALVRLIKHIGGSSKRTPLGFKVGTTGQDPHYSPKGRRLIGRIGIGLFSVAQMTRHFQIVTKRAGSDFRIFADVILDTYNEDKLEEKREEGPESFKTGSVTIQSYPADDIASHGTDIILLGLKPEALAVLTSREDWEAEKSFTYHIGSVNSRDGGGGYATEPSLPWRPSDSPSDRFSQLVSEVCNWSGRQKAKLETILDRYLQVMWKLALSVPLDYLDGVHPFDLGSDAEPRLYRLSNEAKGLAEEVFLNQGESIRTKFKLKAPEKGRLPFSVVMDGVELRRPLRFTELCQSERPQDRPLMFVGSWSPPLDRFPSSTSGGQELSFEAYFLWVPRIVPAEHIGLLVRIADASGILFDETFMDYQVAELTRLRQTSAEIFVHRGLDAALNIDRESFNSGHPHAKLVRYWVHQAFRQLSTTQKRLASELRGVQREAVAAQEVSAVEKVVAEKLGTVGVERTAPVRIDTSSTSVNAERLRGNLAYQETRLLEAVKPLRGKAVRTELPKRKKQLAAIARLLEGFGAFENMDFSRQEELLNGIARVIWGSADE